jgi:hypothetical protein
MKTWPKPTLEQVSGVVRKLGRPGAYRYFFAGLRNPEWIEPLRKLKYFDNPDWPATLYLARMAPEKPDLVAEVVAAIPETENERVRETLVDIALQLPADLAAPIAKRAAKWPRTPGWPFALSSRLAKLAAHLAERGQPDKAFALAGSVFQIRKSRGETGPDANEPEIDLWEYGEALKIALPALLTADAPGTIAFLASSLESALFSVGLISKDEHRIDMSSLRATDLGATDDLSIFDVPHLLARKLIETALDALRSGQVNDRALIDTIERRPWALYRAISLHVLAHVAPLAFPIARDRMLDQDLLDEAPSEQYSQLLRARFGELDTSDRQTILRRVMDGPNIPAAQARYKQASGSLPAEEIVERFRKTWIRDRLLLVSEYLSSEQQGALRELVASVGEPEPEPDGKAFLQRRSTPKTDEEFARMSPSEIAEFARSWVPADGGPVPLALAGQLHAAAMAKPSEFAESARAFIGLRPVYVHHLIWGLEDAARQGKGFDWHPVLSLCLWMLQQPRGSEPEIPSFFRGDEVSWESARQATARLIRVGIDKSTFPDDTMRDVWAIIETLAQDPSPSTRDEERLATHFEPVGLSLNSIRGQAIHAAVLYARLQRQALKKDRPARTNSFDDMPEVRVLLDRHLDVAIDSSLAIRSVYGQYFALLTYLDPDWARDSAPKIFPREENLRPFWRSAWSSYIQYTAAYDNVFRILRPLYALAVERVGDGTSESHSMAERLGAHLVTYYWRGLIGLESNDLLARFMDAAAPDVRTATLDYVGRSLMNTKDAVDAAVLDRLKALWETRLDSFTRHADSDAAATELRGFSFWFASAKFDDHWAMSKLAEVITKLGGDFINAYPIVKRLAVLAPQEPRACVDCLRSFIFGRKGDRPHLATIPEAGIIIQAALASGDQQAISAARQIINALSERGDMRYRGLVG